MNAYKVRTSRVPVLNGRLAVGLEGKCNLSWAHYNTDGFDGFKTYGDFNRRFWHRIIFHMGHGLGFQEVL